MFVDQETLKKIKDEGKEITIARQKLIVPSLSHLIALKPHTIKFNTKIRLTFLFSDAQKMLMAGIIWIILTIYISNVLYTTD